MILNEVGRHGLCPDNKEFGVEFQSKNEIEFKHNMKVNVYYIDFNKCLID